jgi:peptidoglycan/xylan/chitin deacetylase (PgdA/CDA1 family)
VLWTQAQYELVRAELSRRAGAAGLSGEMARIPEVPGLFRPPYGRCSPESLKLLSGLGLSAIQWDVVASEGPGDAQAAAQDILARVRPGSIVLMHANGVPANSAAVLGHLLPALLARGFVPVTVSELLCAGTPKAEAQCYFTHPGDNLFLDEQFGDGTRRVKKATAPSP